MGELTLTNPAILPQVSQYYPVSPLLMSKLISMMFPTLHLSYGQIIQILVRHAAYYRTDASMLAAISLFYSRITRSHTISEEVLGKYINTWHYSRHMKLLDLVSMMESNNLSAMANCIALISEDDWQNYFKLYRKTGHEQDLLGVFRLCMGIKYQPYSIIKAGKDAVSSSGLSTQLANDMHGSTQNSTPQSSSHTTTSSTRSYTPSTSSGHKRKSSRFTGMSGNDDHNGDDDDPAGRKFIRHSHDNSYDEHDGGDCDDDDDIDLENDETSDDAPRSVYSLRPSNIPYALLDQDFRGSNDDGEYENDDSQIDDDQDDEDEDDCDEDDTENEDTLIIYGPRAHNPAAVTLPDRHPALRFPTSRSAPSTPSRGHTQRRRRQTRQSARLDNDMLLQITSLLDDHTDPWFVTWESVLALTDEDRTYPGVEFISHLLLRRDGVTFDTQNDKAPPRINIHPEQTDAGLRLATSPLSNIIPCPNDALPLPDLDNLTILTPAQVRSAVMQRNMDDIVYDMTPLILLCDDPLKDEYPTRIQEKLTPENAVKYRDLLLVFFPLVLIDSFDDLTLDCKKLQELVTFLLYCARRSLGIKPRGRPPRKPKGHRVIEYQLYVLVQFLHEVGFQFIFFASAARIREYLIAYLAHCNLAKSSRSEHVTLQGLTHIVRFILIIRQRYHARQIYLAQNPRDPANANTSQKPEAKVGVLADNGVSSETKRHEDDRHSSRPRSSSAAVTSAQASTHLTQPIVVVSHEPVRPNTHTLSFEQAVPHAMHDADPVPVSDDIKRDPKSSLQTYTMVVKTPLPASAQSAMVDDDTTVEVKSNPTTLLKPMATIDNDDVVSQETTESSQPATSEQASPQLVGIAMFYDPFLRDSDLDGKNVMGRHIFSSKGQIKPPHHHDHHAMHQSTDNNKVGSNNPPGCNGQAAQTTHPIPRVFLSKVSPNDAMTDDESIPVSPTPVIPLYLPEQPAVPSDSEESVFPNLNDLLSPLLSSPAQSQQPMSPQEQANALSPLSTPASIAKMEASSPLQSAQPLHLSRLHSPPTSPTRQQSVRPPQEQHQQQQHHQQQHEEQPLPLQQQQQQQQQHQHQHQQQQQQQPPPLQQQQPHEQQIEHHVQTAEQTPAQTEEQTPADAESSQEPPSTQDAARGPLFYNPRYIDSNEHKARQARINGELFNEFQL